MENILLLVNLECEEIAAHSDVTRVRENLNLNAGKDTTALIH